MDLFGKADVVKERQKRAPRLSSRHASRDIIRSQAQPRQENAADILKMIEKNVAAGAGLVTNS